MKIETNIVISKDKTKFIAKIGMTEFIKGDWLKYVPSSNNLDIKYTARTELLTIIDTTKINVKKREVIE